MKLEWAGQTGNTHQLRVVGVEASSVTLQGSFNLTGWFPLQSATPSQGTATFSHTPSDPAAALFYRAVAEPPVVEINVGPQVDAAQAVTALITPEAGGTLRFTDTRGVLFTLTVPTNGVVEAELLTMTVITNFISLPLEDRFRAAVTFAPDGFEFRRPAELKIHFPEPLPELEMMGYAFDGAGGGFHLHPWEQEGQEVTLAVSHFSGAGTLAQSFQGNPNLDFKTVNRTYFDAMRNANNDAARSQRTDAQLLREGQIDRAQFEARNQSTEELRIIDIVRFGIDPGLAAAAADCELGFQTLIRLQGLVGAAAEPDVKDLPSQRIEQLAPLVRCNCARSFIEKCEKDLTANGAKLSRQLTYRLPAIAAMTGKSDAQGCDLGDDVAMFERMARAACHGEWEGTVKYHVVETEKGRLDLGSVIQEHQILYQFTYTGHIVALDSREFIDHSLSREDGDNRPDEWFWFFTTEGKISGFFSERNTFVIDDPIFTSTTIERTLGSASYQKRGDKLNLHFLGDALGFEEVNFGVGLDEAKYPMSRKTITVNTIECKVPDTRRCPKPAPTTQSIPFTRDMFGAIGGDRNDKDPKAREVKFTYANGRLMVTVTEKLNTPLTGNSGLRKVEETLTVELWRGAKP